MLRIIEDRGLTTSQNVIDNLLSFNVASNWTVIGTGNASRDTNTYFDGSGSLRINNTAYKTIDLSTTNSVQSTVIGVSGIYDFSLYLKKSLAEDVSLKVEINKNGSVLYDAPFTFGEDYVDCWTSFVTNENFNLTKGDIITFRFYVLKNASSSVTDFTLYADGLHFYNKDRCQLEAPIYQKPISQPQVTVTGGAQYKDGLYTSASPLNITEGSTVKLTCNNAVVVDNNIPSDFVNGMWSSVNNKLQAVNQKDWFDLEIRFKAKNSENNGYFDVFIDIGATDEISRETSIFSRLSNTEQSFKPNFDYYSGALFIANGGEIKIEATKGNLSVYDIEILPFRKHKGY